MANLQYSGDILDYALFHAGEPTDGTSDFEAQSLVELNRAYRALWLGGGEFSPNTNEEWWWLRKSAPGVLTMEPSITGGTANVTNNSTSVTMSSAPSPANDADVSNWYFKVDAHADIFRVSTQVTTTVTLDSVYTGDTDTAANYKLFKLDYSLANDVLRVLSPMRVYQDSRHKVNGMELDSLEFDYPLRDADAGTPTAFAMTAEQSVRFNKYGGTSSTELTRVDYDYLQVPSVLTDSGSEEPLVPWHYRSVLADAALYFLLTVKNDNRAVIALQRVQAGVESMKKENRAAINRFGDQNGKIMPRQDHMQRIRAPIRTSSGLIIG